MEPNESCEQSKHSRSDDIGEEVGWINLRALRWWAKQKDLGLTAKAVLMSFAMDADERGYSFPDVGSIASTWSIDRKTVARAIKRLLGKRTLFPTKARRGATGQVKVYRLPKSSYESGAPCPPFKNQSGAKEGISGA